MCEKQCPMDLGWIVLSVAAEDGVAGLECLAADRSECCADDRDEHVVQLVVPPEAFDVLVVDPLLCCMLVLVQALTSHPPAQCTA
eukprot:1418269-Rhodomonas_salina.3